MAYLTDHDSVTKFSVGKVDIVGHEPNYTPDNDENQQYRSDPGNQKDPQIEKCWKNDAMYIGCFYPDCKRDYC